MGVSEFEFSFLERVINEGTSDGRGWWIRGGGEEFGFSFSERESKHGVVAGVTMAGGGLLEYGEEVGEVGLSF